MKNKLFFYGVILFQVFNIFSSDSEITTEPSVGMFKVKSSQDYQSLKKPTNMKIFVGKEALNAIPAQDEEIKKVLIFIHEKNITIPEDVRSVEVLIRKKSIIIAYRYLRGKFLFKEYSHQFSN